jgi:hypothetical protein
VRKSVPDMVGAGLDGGTGSLDCCFCPAIFWKFVPVWKTT